MQTKRTPLFTIPLACMVLLASCGSDPETRQDESTSTTATTSPVPAATSQAIAIKDFKFTPAKLTVTTGAKVTWTNEDIDIHTVTSDPGVPVAFDTGDDQPGKTVSVTFTTPGTYTYHCNIHPGMTGAIIVTQP